MGLYQKPHGSAGVSPAPNKRARRPRSHVVFLIPNPYSLIPILVYNVKIALINKHLQFCLYEVTNLVMMEKIKLAIFDFDLTIVDSSDAVTTGMNALAKYKGLTPVTKEQVKKGIGLPILEAFYDLWGKSDPSWIDYYRQSITELEYTLIKPYNDAIPTLTELRKKGIKLAVASNRQRPADALEKLKLFQYFDDAIGLNDGVTPKPSPEMLNVLMQRFNVTPDETVYIGDSLIDMETAVSAKTRGIGVTTGNHTAAEIISAGAWKSINSLWELTECLTF